MTDSILFSRCSRLARLGTLCLLMFLSVSCAHVHQPSDMADTGHPSSGPVASEPFRVFTGDYDITPEFKQNLPQSIAVLPFTGDPDDWSVRPEGKTPPQILREAMYNHISSLPFRDLEMYMVDRRLDSMGITSPQAAEAAALNQPAAMYQALGVDAVIIGEVTYFDRVWLAAYSQVLVGCDLAMYSLPDGRLLWRARHTSRSHGGGIPLSPLSLAMSAISALWNVRESQLLTQTDILFREIVDTIDYGLPQSMREQGPPPPVIDLFVCLNPEQTFREGDIITFRMVGPPGLEADASLPGYQPSIILRPVPESVKRAQWEQTVALIRQQAVETGHAMTPDMETAIREELDRRQIYEGTCTVRPGEEHRDMVAELRVSRPGSAQVLETTAPGRITVDSRPPAMPTGLHLESLDNRLRLTWTPNLEQDVALYEIHASSTPLTGYSQVGQAQDTSFLLQSLNFSTLHFTIRAMDTSGNTGPFSAPLSGSALPEPGIDQVAESQQMLGGTLDGELRLTREMSPYTLRSSLNIVPGGALYIEPGVTLLFAPGTALLVAGGSILAYGQAGQPIIFRPLSESAGQGAYQGLILDQSQRAILHHVHIDRAATGIRISNSAPELRSIEISNSSQAAMHLLDNAEPSLSCSYLHDNQGMGALLVEGVGSSPDFHGNVFENNVPFHIQNFSPLTLNLSRNYWGTPYPGPELFLGHVLVEPVLQERPAPLAPCAP